MSNRRETEKLAGLIQSPLRVHLLGPPQIEWAGQPLSIPRRQARALLYRLAARLEPIPREQLCFLFWPDTPDGETPLLREDGFLDALQRAANLYCDSFLAGFSLSSSPEFEAWASLEQQILERRYLEILSALIEDYAARSEYDPAVACAHRYLAIDDLAEETHCRLIELYAAAGDRSAALRQYEHCTEVLERELGVDPLPETQAVYEAVLAGKPSQGVAPVTAPTWTCCWWGVTGPCARWSRRTRVPTPARARRC